MYHVEDRPTSFSEVIGNEAVIAGIWEKMESEDRPHVYLFHGPCGVGKTTMARICANQLVKDQNNIIEINGNRNNGVDDARSLESDFQFSTMGGGNRVYIVDEVEKTTNGWQGVMKKPLEDIPSHIYVFMCTTEPKKLLPDIRSRASEWKFKPLKDDEVRTVLFSSIRKHKLSIDEKVLDKIIANAEGSPREALTVLEKVTGLSVPKAMEVIDFVDIDDTVRDLCKMLLAGKDWNTVRTVVKSIRIDPEAVRKMVLGYMNTVLLRSSGKSADMAYKTISVFEKSLIESGRAGLTACCYYLVK